MQSVRDLAGYTLGRSDLVRRAMSKKKASVMEKERQNFVYGNEEEGVKGCIANGIDEKTANRIYDEMIDFAKYAFNKSHAAAYAVVSYQTAFLKYYYPVEYMAALMTSVIDNPGKVSEYIVTCRNMGIEILPPDINEGSYDFSVSGNSIRFGLSAIKGVGMPVIKEIEEIRFGLDTKKFATLQDFIEKMAPRGTVNKRVVENFIKAGVFDSLGHNRRQCLLIYNKLMDAANNGKKNDIAGQMSLFDWAPEEEKESYKITMPDVPEFEKEIMLAFEKEVLGIYISGHPLENYMDVMKKNTTNTTRDFLLNDETNEPAVTEGATAILGGMITAKNIKHTKNNQTMAFLTLEDMVGAVEVVVFPRDYERNARLLVEDNKVFIRGRVNVEEERGAKLICEKMIGFEEIPKELWIKFDNKERFGEKEQELYEAIKTSDGNDSVVIYVEDIKAIKRLPPNKNVLANETLAEQLTQQFGEGTVKIVQKSIGKLL